VDQTEAPGVVVHLDEAGTDKHVSVLQNVANLLDEMGAGLQVEVVAHGPGTDVCLRDSGMPGSLILGGSVAAVAPHQAIATMSQCVSTAARYGAEGSFHLAAVRRPVVPHDGRLTASFADLVEEPGSRHTRTYRLTHRRSRYHCRTGRVPSDLIGEPVTCPVGSAATGGQPSKGGHAPCICSPL
jgi:intracellular sulfur oxidation DsrE/DsrF family protein